MCFVSPSEPRPLQGLAPGREAMFNMQTPERQAAITAAVGGQRGIGDSRVRDLVSEGNPELTRMFAEQDAQAAKSVTGGSGRAKKRAVGVSNKRKRTLLSETDPAKKTLLGT